MLSFSKNSNTHFSLYKNIHTQLVIWSRCYVGVWVFIERESGTVCVFVNEFLETEREGFELGWWGMWIVTVTATLLALLLHKKLPGFLYFLFLARICYDITHTGPPLPYRCWDLIGKGSSTVIRQYFPLKSHSLREFFAL